MLTKCFYFSYCTPNGVRFVLGYTVLEIFNSSEGVLRTNGVIILFVFAPEDLPAAVRAKYL